MSGDVGGGTSSVAFREVIVQLIKHHGIDREMMAPADALAELMLQSLISYGEVRIAVMKAAHPEADEG